METVGVEPTRPRCKRGALPPELHPLSGCGRVESNHHSARHRGYSPVSSPCSASARRRGGRRIRTGPRDHDLGCCRYTTATMERRPTGFEPATSSDRQPADAALATELRHHDRKPGTTGLKPARARRQASALAAELRPRCIARWDSNPRSRAHEAREDSLSSTARSARLESNQRSPAPKAGGVASLPYRPAVTLGVPPAGLEPAASGLRVRRHSCSTTGACSSGGRDRTCASRLTVARLTARPHRSESGGSGFEPAWRQATGALAMRCLSKSASLQSGRRGSRTPKGRGPPVFETGYRAWWQSFRR